MNLSFKAKVSYYIIDLSVEKNSNLFMYVLKLHKGDRIIIMKLHIDYIYRHVGS